MSITCGVLERSPMITVSGDLDHSGGAQLLKLGLECIETGADVIVIDLYECLYMDSGGLGALFTLLRSIRAYGILVVVGANPSVGRVLGMSGLLHDPAFRMLPDRAAAVMTILEWGSCPKEASRRLGPAPGGR